MNYTETFPELAALMTGARVAPLPLPFKPVRLWMIYEAIREEKSRVNFHKSAPVAVTSGDIVHATIRTHVIVQQHLAVMYPNLSTPPWAIDLRRDVHQLGDQLQQVEQRMRQDVQDQIQQAEQRLSGQVQQVEQRIGGQLQQVEQRMGQAVHNQGQQFAVQLQQAEQRLGDQLQQAELVLQGEHQNIAAIVHNTGAALHNARAIRDGAVTDRVQPFRRFVKATPGLGIRLPRARAPQTPIPVLQVGEIVPEEYFPENYAVLQRWGHQQISDLCILLNDNFEINGTDDLAGCRMKLQRFLSNQ